MYKQKKQFFTEIAEKNTEMCTTMKIPVSTLVYSYEVNNLGEKPLDISKIEVHDTSTDGGVKLAHSQKYKNIVVMNFASNKNTGGGYLNGSSAQEEDCCRLFPALYTSLKNATVINPATKKVRSIYPFDKRNVVVTPNVMLMRDRKTYDLLPENNMINATFVSVSAPNLRYEKFNESHVNAALKTSLLAPIRTDIKFNNPKNNCLILGAWGCGAYRNDPTAMSEYMKDIALRYGGYYDKIIFAIPDGPDGNHEIFKQTIC
jgi:uncharacterized protein (TIGR02452 family)